VKKSNFLAKNPNKDEQIDLSRLGVWDFVCLVLVFFFLMSFWRERERIMSNRRREGEGSLFLFYLIPQIILFKFFRYYLYANFYFTFFLRFSLRFLVKKWKFLIFFEKKTSNFSKKHNCFHIFSNDCHYFILNYIRSLKIFFCFYF